ncbi:PAS domain-containing sensor histidine kinase [Fulvivirga maritima]|uniref:PAS domain-containing sensor histidine kinase n=1 Tax=Fulvivirga maritima TaxID=2904247 RepID=UPI001F39D154|nr:PAS domain-containing sensor histidine kinase [Fulvivirga maritima]UII26255.1 PAS domain-containing sensor histidine kinase [Fulvivirga maritima]
MELSPNSDFKNSTLTGVFDHLLQGNNGVAIINSEKKILEYNELFREIFGEVGCLDDILNYPGQNDLEEQVFSFLNTCEHNRSRSFSIFTKSEYVKLSLSCFKYDELKYFIAKVEQVSDNYPISNLVRESLAFSKLIASSTFELIFMCTEDGKLVYFNKLFAKTLDYPSLLAARKKGVNEILSGDFLRIKDELNASESNLITEQVWLRKNNGGLIRGLANISIHRNRHGEYIYNWVVLDLTQYTEYEKYLKTTNTQLKRVSFQLEQFLYSTSHDLRSPLTSIMGLVNLIKGEVQNDTVEKYVNLIEQTAFGLDTVIKNIAYLTRINYYESNYERIDMQRLIWNMISEYTRDPESKAIDWKVEVDESFYFYSDEEKIEIILDQLIKNAVAFRDSTKAQSIIEITVMEQNDNVVITVFDNGLGIEDKHIKLVCNLFYKASAVSSGSGLGLFIVKEALDNLDGKLNIGSQIGVGSWITMEIPNQKRKYMVTDSRKSKNNSKMR